MADLASDGLDVGHAEQTQADDAEMAAGVQQAALSSHSVLESEGLEVKRVGPRAPNMNAYAERWVQTIKTECQDHFVVLGEAHLRHIVSEFVTYYHEHRPHQAKDNLPLVGDSPPETTDVIRCKDVVCRNRLGGLLKSYAIRAA